MHSEEVLRIRLQLSDAQRRQAGKRIRKHMPAVFHRRKRLTAWAVLAVYAGLLWLLYHFLSASTATIYGNCYLYGASEMQVDGCLEGAADAVRAQSHAMYVLLAGALLGIAYTHYSYLSTWRSALRSLNGREFLYTIDPQGFTGEEAGVSQLYFTWAGVRQVVRDGDMLLIFIENGVAYFVPLAAFADAAEGERFFVQAQAWHTAQHDQMLRS